MGIELIELVEVKRNDGYGADVCDVYEVYSGDWVQVYGYSANPYWHTYEKWKTEMSDRFNHVDRRYIQVLAGPRYVGHWIDKDQFYHFIKFYLRAEITEIVTQ